jgi:uncharacterized glyoxalase superfamily protein PhnB
MPDDELDALRRLRPDRVLPDDPADPHVLAQGRDRLLSEISGRDRFVERVPQAIYPRLAYDDEYAALDYLIRVFGFRERREARQEYPHGMLAWLELNGGVVMICAAGPHGLRSPRLNGHCTAMVNVYVDDVDAHYRRAVAEGARIVLPIEDMFWGDRRYEALDEEGHRWHFGTRLSDVRRRANGAATHPTDPPTREPAP